MAIPSYYENPEFFRTYRANLDPVDPKVFDRLFGLVEVTVNSDVTAYYQSSRPGVIGLTEGPRNLADFESGVEVEVERDGPLRTKDGRPLDARIFTEHSYMRKELGVMGLIGVHWRPMPTLLQKMEQGELSGDPTLAEVGYSLADARIPNLWMMSKENSLHWVTDYEEGRPISDFELAQLTADLERN